MISHLMQKAEAQERAGHLVDAEASYRNIIAMHPKFHPAYQALGLLVYAAGNLAISAELFRTALTLAPEIALYHRNYGEICRRLGKFIEAIEAGKVACRLSPLDVDAWFNLGLACSDAKDVGLATHAYLRVLELLAPLLETNTAMASTWNMRGVTMHRLGRFDEARSSYERALEMQPESPVALNSLGSLLIDIGSIQAARDCFAKAVSLAPDFAMARLNLGMSQLKLGDWQHGWENYEARWTGSAESGNGTFLRPSIPLPQWDGDGDTSKLRLLIFAEQGFGDLFQFSRYLEPVVRRFAKVGFVCPDSSTYVLMEWSFGESMVLLKNMPLDFNLWDRQCSLMSLPHAFRTTLESIPSVFPYLRVSNHAQSYWCDRLDATDSKRFRVGLAWSGRKSHQYDARRSINFELLLPLLDDPRISWISLQKLRSDEARPEIPADITWIDWTEELIDFADTAAVVSNLDLVISIDSAMVHLAGGLGRPVWMLNRFDAEWRWLERREDSPWYPSLRIFNQPQLGDWSSVLNVVKAALAALWR